MTPKPVAVLFHEPLQQSNAQGERDKMQRSRYVCFTAFAGALTLAAGVAHGSAALPDGFTAQDIGKVKAGDTSITGTGDTAVWTLTSQGGDIQNKGDIFRFVSHDLAGNGGITARVLSQTGGAKGGWSKSGVMIRQSIDPGSVMDTMNFSFTGAKQAAPMLEVLHRDKAANNPAGYGVAAHDPATGPIWLRAQRVGTDYQLLRSDNGKDWQKVDDRALTIDATAPVVAGITTSSGNATDPPTVATFDNVSVSADIIQPDIVPGPGPIEVLPGNGQVLLTFPTMANAAGYNIYRQEAGSKTPAVLVTQQPDPYGWFVDTGLTNGTNYIYSVSTVSTSLADPTKTVESAPGTLSQVLATPQLPVAGLTSIDIGTMTPGTTTMDDKGVLTITASGVDIWNASDSFRLAGTTATGDYSLTAKLIEKPSKGAGNTEAWVKAGVMIRESLDPAARAVMVAGTSGNGVAFQYRQTYNTAGASDVSQQGTKDSATTYPQWLRLSRQGDSITGFQSSDGTTWTQTGPPAVLPGLAAETIAGLAVTSHKDGKLGTGKFDATSLRFGAPYTAPAAAPPKP